MERVVSELTAFGIEPETAEDSNSSEQRTSELLSRVKLRAAQIIESKHGEDDPIDLETIRIALDPKSIVPKQDEEKAMSAQMVANVEQVTVDVQKDNPKLPAVEVTAAQKNYHTKDTQKIFHCKIPKKQAIRKRKNVNQQVSMDDIAIIELF